MPFLIKSEAATGESIPPDMRKTAFPLSVGSVDPMEVWIVSVKLSFPNRFSDLAIDIKRFRFVLNVLDKHSSILEDADFILFVR